MKSIELNFNSSYSLGLFTRAFGKVLRDLMVRTVGPSQAATQKTLKSKGWIFTDVSGLNDSNSIT